MDDLQFYVISTVFQSYQDDGQMLMKGCVQWMVGWLVVLGLTAL